MHKRVYAHSDQCACGGERLVSPTSLRMRFPNLHATYCVLGVEPQEPRFPLFRITDTALMASAIG